MTTPTVKDLFVLTADSQLQRTIETLLNRRRLSLRIRDISFETQRHPRKDPGCRTESVSYLREIRSESRKAMVVFDFEGCGAPDATAGQLEVRLERGIESAGWSRSDIAVIVIEPELEAWLFGASLHHLEIAVGWPRREPLREWMTSNGHLIEGSMKPANPMEAVEAMLSEARTPRSANLYEDIAGKISLARCQDRAFQKFRTTLQRWFPVS